MNHLVTRAVVPAVLALASTGPARAADLDGNSTAAPAATRVDRREIIVPARGAELVRIDNLLGRVGIRGTARPGEIHVVAAPQQRPCQPLTDESGPTGQQRSHLAARLVALKVGVDHHAHQLLELYPGSPAQLLSGFCRVAQQ